MQSVGWGDWSKIDAKKSVAKSQHSAHSKKDKNKKTEKLTTVTISKKHMSYSEYRR